MIKQYLHNMYRIVPVLDDDMGIILNYISDELGIEVVKKIKTAMLARNIGWKIEKEGVLLGYFLLEIDSKEIFISSYFVAREYRNGLVSYLLAEKLLEQIDKSVVKYKPAYKNMRLIGVCENNILDVVTLKKRINILRKRYGVK